MTAPADNCLVKSTPHTGGTNNFALHLNWSTRGAGWSGFEGGHVCCPQPPSTPRAALSGAFVQVQLTIGCIPPSKWGTWFAGTWNALHSIHMDSCFWTVPSLLRPLFWDKCSLWHKKYRNKLWHIQCIVLLTVTVRPSCQTNDDVNILSVCGNRLLISE